ncbi:MAG: phage tail tape measure protein, partial [Nitrospiria bacterium]
EAVIAGMGQFAANSKKVTSSFTDIDTAANKTGKAAEDMGLHFDSASGKWRNASGQFASGAELASAGIKKAEASAFSFGGIADGVKTSVLNLGNMLLKLGTIAGGAVLTGVIALGTALTTFAIGGINKAADLDQKMADIAATMGIAKNQTGELKDLIFDLSLDPGLTVNATQAASAIEVLAANGAELLDTQGHLTESGRELTTQVVAMSNATGGDFALSAAIATDSMNIFGLSADEVSKAVDGAAGVMIASKFDANDYALALAQAGSVAAGSGVNIEDFNTVIAATASQFSSGGDAGTSFKVALQRLANPAKEVQEAMARYGISIFDSDGKMRDMAEVASQLNAVFNGTATITTTAGGATKEMAKAAEQAEKNMKPLGDTISEQEVKLSILQQDLQGIINKYGAGSKAAQQKSLDIMKLTNNLEDNRAKYVEYQGAIAAVQGAQEKTITTTKELTQAEKAELAATLGGADGARTLLGLANLTEDQFRELSGQVNKTGLGMQAAATRVDSLKGAMEIFGGVVEAVQIQVGDKFLPILRRLTVGFTELASR